MCVGAAGAQHPDNGFITADDPNFDSLGCYGSFAKTICYEASSRCSRAVSRTDFARRDDADFLASELAALAAEFRLLKPR